jgi:hypothetical protein
LELHHFLSGSQEPHQITWQITQQVAQPSFAQVFSIRPKHESKGIQKLCTSDKSSRMEFATIDLLYESLAHLENMTLRYPEVSAWSASKITISWKHRSFVHHLICMPSAAQRINSSNCFFIPPDIL